MCMTVEALVLFLSILSEDRIELGTNSVTVNAEVGPVVYEKIGTMWCSERPRSEEMLRLVYGDPV